MRTCFVPKCDKLNKHFAPRKYFTVPKQKDLREKWINALPKLRVLKVHDKVCERHFRKEDIITTYDHVIKGEIFQLERGRAKLKQSAIPCLNLPSEEELKVAICKKTAYKRKAKNVEMKLHETIFELNIQNITDLKDEEKSFPLEYCVDTQNKLTEESRIKNQEHKDSALEIIHGQTELNTSPELSDIFNSLYDEIYEVVLPNTLWGVHRCPERTKIFFSFMDPKQMRVKKLIAISNLGFAKVYVADRLIRNLRLAFDVSSAEVLSNLIAETDCLQVCTNAFKTDLCEVEAKSGSELCFCCTVGLE